MADLSNLKIANTYSRLLQVDPDTNQLQDGVGSNPSTIIFNGTTLKYVDGNQQNNYILTSDANGVARWAANSGGGGGSTNVYWGASSVDGTFIINSGVTNSANPNKVGIGTLIPNHELSVSGTVSASTEILVGDGAGLISAATIHVQTLSSATDLYLGSAAQTESTIFGEEEITIKGRAADNDYMTLKQDRIDFHLDGSQAATFIAPTHSSAFAGFSFNSSNLDMDFKVGGKDNFDILNIDGGTGINKVRLRDHLVIGDNAAISHANAILWGLAVTGSSLFYGGENEGDAIHASGVISASTKVLAGDGNGIISAATINGVELNGTLGRDASPVTAYINNGEIDNVTIGGESRALAITTETITLQPQDAADVPLTLTAHESAEGNWVSITNAGGDSYFKMDNAGRTTIAHGTITTADINGGNIDGTAIGSASRSTGKFTSMDVNSTLVVTGNTTLNGTLSATTSCKVGNGVGLVSAATVTAAGSVTLPDDGKLKLGNAGDLEIYHDSNNSYIDDTGTGTLFYRSGTQTFQNAAGSKTMAVFNAASTVDLSFNNNVKLSTNTSGIHVDGTVSANTAVYAGTGVDDGVISAGTVNGSYQFITFVGNTGALSNDYWTGPSTNGISNHSWTDQWDDTDGTSTGSTAISLGRTEQMAYIRVPAGARLVGLEGVVRSNVNDRAYAGLFTFLPDYEGPNSADATLRIMARTPSSSNNLTNDPQTIKEYAAFADQHVFADGECIVPAVRRDSTSSQSLVASFTIILKY